VARSTGRRRAAAGATGLRVGLGADVHPLADGRRLVLGGVEIPHPRGLAGHSDADALAHAVCDALLGALGLPDMGTRFPDVDPRHRDRPSLEFVREVAREARGRGFAIHNVDTVLFAEEPCLRPHIEPMRRALAGALGVPPGAVGVKAKRSEGLGALGRAEGVLAQAVVLIGAAPAGRAAGAPRKPRPGRARARSAARRSR